MAGPQVPDNISEEYYQISEQILSSFPKYRPPLDLFVFNTSIGQLVTYARKGDRLTNEQVEESRNLCLEGDLYVSRADHPIYSKHIVKQLDLVLVDNNLKEAEVASICISALEIKLNEFFEQPVKPVFEKMYADIMVVTEYLWTDLHRLRLFVKRLFCDEHTLARQSINTMIVGLWLYTVKKEDEFRRKDFDQAAVSLLLKDAGMSKVPGFITAKTTPLKVEEKEKIYAHPLTSYKIMHKLDQTYDLMRQACLEHHERMDGSGYPQHSKDISAFGRLTAVADAFSAMLQKRPYAEGMPLMAAAQALSTDKNKFDFTYSGQILAGLVSDSFGKVSKGSKN